MTRSHDEVCKIIALRTLTAIVGKIPVLSGIRRIPERTGILAIIIVTCVTNF